MEQSAFLQQAIDYIRDLPWLLKTLFLTFAIAIEYVLPIFPGDSIVLISGFLSAHNALAVIELCSAVVLGSLIGALCGYYIGLFIASNPNRYQWMSKFTASSGYKKFNQWYQRFGIIFLLLNRFIPGIRALFFIAAGFARLSLVKVLICGMVSALLYNAVLLIIGFWFGNNTDLIMYYFYRYNIVAYIVIGLFLLVFILWWWRKKNIRSPES